MEVPHICTICDNDANHPVFFRDANDEPKVTCMTCATHIHKAYVGEP